MKPISPVLAVLLTLSLAGSEEPKPWGANVGVAIPQGDLKEFLGNKPGFKVGGAYQLGFKGGHVLRPRAEYVYFKGEQNTAGQSRDTKVVGLGLGADYLFYPGGNPGSGFYLTAGLGFTHWTAEYAYGSSTYVPPYLVVGASAAAIKVQLDDSNDSADYGAGVGFQINENLGVELRYDTSEFDSNKDKGDRLQVIFQFRFGDRRKQD